MAKPLVRTQASPRPALVERRTREKTSVATVRSAPNRGAETDAVPSAAFTVEPASGTLTNAPTPSTPVAIQRPRSPRSRPGPPDWNGTARSAPTTKRGPGACAADEAASGGATEGGAAGEDVAIGDGASAAVGSRG